MIIGLLGILKQVELMFLLIQPTLKIRLQFMLEDTNAPVLITQAHLKESFKEYPGKILSLQLDAKTKDLLIEDSSLHTDEL